MTATAVVLDQEVTDKYAIYHADCVDVLRGIPSDTMDFIVTSVPFASLYTYSNSERDMGNVRSEQEFAEHYGYLAKELYRVLKPGRLMSIHCMNLPTSKERDGVIGLSDFRGDLIRLHTKDCFIYHSEVCIWKDPVTAMQRTKAIGLLHKQVVKDSAMSRQGIPDYLVTFRKPGINPDPVKDAFNMYSGELPEPTEVYTRADDRLNPYSIAVWQRYASPVWFDINASDTLQKESAREEEDERHIAPLQLQVIDRALQLWTNPGDTVLDPFAGIGSSGVVAIRRGRRFVGAELKHSYFLQSRQNLRDAVIKTGQQEMDLL